jgi:hypothetical protein
LSQPVFLRRLQIDPSRKKRQALNPGFLPADKESNAGGTVCRSRFQWKPSCAKICRNSGAGVSRNATQTHFGKMNQTIEIKVKVPNILQVRARAHGNLGVFSIETKSNKP